MNEKVIAVLPAYNAARTLKRTYDDIPKNTVDEIILVDDASTDRTVEIARDLGIKVFVHHRNKGYGANQKTCYEKALLLGADIVVMVHPDYQYDPKVVPDLVDPIMKNEADACFGSRMMKKNRAIIGGMPKWKFYSNIFLTHFENLVLGMNLTEYHSGFRAYSRKYLETIKFESNSDDFIFDTEIIIQGKLARMRIKEVPINTRYFDSASTIGFGRCLTYGLGIITALARYILHKTSLVQFKQFTSV